MSGISCSVSVFYARSTIERNQPHLPGKEGKDASFPSIPFYKGLGHYNKRDKDGITPHPLRIERYSPFSQDCAASILQNEGCRPFDQSELSWQCG
jgi:hypothetical protein